MTVRWHNPLSVGSTFTGCTGGDIPQGRRASRQGAQKGDRAQALPGKKGLQRGFMCPHDVTHQPGGQLAA